VKGVLFIVLVICLLLFTELVGSFSPVNFLYSRDLIGGLADLYCSPSNEELVSLKQEIMDSMGVVGGFEVGQRDRIAHTILQRSMESKYNLCSTGFNYCVLLRIGVIIGLCASLLVRLY
jgi:hypothetical protein